MQAMLKPRIIPKQKNAVALPLSACLAKTCLRGTCHEPGRLVEEHCRIAGAVGREYLKRLCAVWPGAENIFPANAYMGPLLHDVGKVCPTFQKKIHQAAGSDAGWPQLADVNPDIEKDWGKHAAVSYAAIKAFGGGESLALSLGVHHGRDIKQKPADCGHFGGEAWAAARNDLIVKLVGSEDLPAPSGQVQTLLLAGLTILADWIASGDVFSDPKPAWEPIITRSVDQAGFVFPEIRQGLSFREIFGFSPNNCQEALSDAVTGPGIYILEAPMGFGKTEAALYAAYQALARHDAAGVYFALPTQLTSNRMHERVDRYLGSILHKPASSALAHKDAWLSRFREQNMGEHAAPGGEWFESGRRAILAPFAVGTVDQVLMAAMRVPWAPLRLLGLAGKVVILDEIHSYDSYMSQLLDALLRLLAQMGSTVIILSATLTKTRRESIVQAVSPRSRPCGDAPYPLLTVCNAGSDAQAVLVPQPDQAQVSLQIMENDDPAFEEILNRAADGQQCVWLENTVGMAQDVFCRLAARASNASIDIGLLHSRFSMSDRERNEKKWTDVLGKPGREGAEARCACGRILVGTQVIEQSLDIDADFMVTRFCPTDLILQRLGRLWRHERDNRPAGSRREAWLLAPALEQALHEPAAAFNATGTGRVYPPYVLARSLEVWHGLTLIRLPKDMRRLLEASHCRRVEEPTKAMLEALNKQNRDSERKAGLALQGISTIGKLLSEDAAGTRLVDVKTVAVLLLADLDLRDRICRLRDGETVDLNPSLRGMAKFRTAATLAMHTVRVPVYSAPDPAGGAAQALFAPFFHEAGMGELRVLKIDAAGRAYDPQDRLYENVYYDRRRGYFYDSQEAR